MEPNITNPDHVANFTLETVLDGSTFIGLIDYGLDVMIRKKVRLVNVKCHEPITEPGRAALEFVVRLLAGRKLRVVTLRDQYRKWSTVLVILYFKDNGKGWINVNDVLIRYMEGSLDGQQK